MSGKVNQAGGYEKLDSLPATENSFGSPPAPPPQFYDVERYQQVGPPRWQPEEKRCLYNGSGSAAMNCVKGSSRIKKNDGSLAGGYMSRKPSGWKSELALERMELEVASLPQNEYIRWYRSKRGFQVNFRGHAKWFSAFSRGVSTAYSMACEWLRYVQNMVRNEPPPNRILAMNKYGHDSYVPPMNHASARQWQDHNMGPSAQSRQNYYLFSPNGEYAAGPPAAPPAVPQQFQSPVWNSVSPVESYSDSKGYGHRAIQWLPKVTRGAENKTTPPLGPSGTNPVDHSNEWFTSHNSSDKHSDV